jgi:hypothetical protein
MSELCCGEFAFLRDTVKWPVTLKASAGKDAWNESADGVIPRL